MKDFVEDIKERLECGEGEIVKDDIYRLIEEVERLNAFIEQVDAGLLERDEQIDSLTKERDELKERAEYWMGERDKKNNLVHDLTEERDEFERLYRDNIHFSNAQEKRMVGREKEIKKLETESAGWQERYDALKKVGASFINENAELKKKVDELEFEVEVLRLYGNKDCTAMADERIATGEPLE